MKTLRVVVTVNLAPMIICAVCGIIEYYYFAMSLIFGELRAVNGALFFLPYLLNVFLAPLNVLLIIIYAALLRKRDYGKAEVIHLSVVAALTVAYIILHYTELNMIMRAVMSV